MKKALRSSSAIVMAALVLIQFAACTKDGKEASLHSPAPTEAAANVTPEPTVSPWEREYVSREFDCLRVQKLEYGRDYTSLYDKFGKDAVLSEVLEDETGLAYIERDGEKYELGLDFLSKAMINNFEPCEGYETADEVYAGWWRLYIKRWNRLMPQIPLLQTVFYSLYNTEIGGVKEHPLSPYCSQTEALIYWTSAKEDNSVIIGKTDDPEGYFRLPQAGAFSDEEIARLVCGLELVAETNEGGYMWNPTVVRSHTETVNADGSRTFDITIFDDLRFSDGSPVTAVDYLVKPMVCMTPVLREALNNDALNIWSFVPYSGSPRSYDGSSPLGRELKEARLISDYEFSVTIPADASRDVKTGDYAQDFYCIKYFCITPEPHEAWLGDARICDDGEGCYITQEFYRQEGVGEERHYAENERLNELLTASSLKDPAKYPWSGPYKLAKAEETDEGPVFTLEKNPYFKGNYEGVVPSIEKVVYKAYVETIWLDSLEDGRVDIITDLVGEKERQDVLRMAEDSEGRFAAISYKRAGYGALSFRADLGPVQFASVRRALAYCFDREEFCLAALGEEKSFVNAPYHEDSWMFKAAKEKGLALEEYPFDIDKAIEELEADGWIYGVNGEPYESGVRYKRIPLDYMDEKDLAYTVTVEQHGSNGEVISSEEYSVNVVGDQCYMPLALNEFLFAGSGTEDLMFFMFTNDEEGCLKKAGIAIGYALGSMMELINQLCQGPIYGLYSEEEIVPKYNLFYLGSSFNSPRYDYSEAFTIDPEFYGSNSQLFFRDYADIYWMKDAG